MAVSLAQDEQFTFVAGLNTEAGYFTFPKNTWKDGDNLIPDVSGVLSKRKAIDLEAAYVLGERAFSSTDRGLWAFTSATWVAVGGNGDLNFIVAQVGRYIHFYLDTSLSTSSYAKGFSIDLNNYKVSSSPYTIGSAPIKAQSANGKLLITSRDTDPILVEYDTGTDTISHSRITVQIRDFEGLDDGLAIDEQPTSLTDAHKYNLYNQGWPSDKVTAYYTAKSKYPSNAQSWIYGKDSSDNFDANVLDKQDFGTSPAPKGRYVLDAFNQDRSDVSGIAGLAVVSESTRPTVCAFFAGRAWYAGVKSTKLGSTVFFSQVALESDKYGKCYQDADPTSEVISDLVDSDGGSIAIQDCGEIVDLLSNDNGIMVMATNGVWTIVGTSQNGFTATGYEVRKLSSFGCVSQQSIVEVDDVVLYWSYNSICRIGKDQVGQNQITSLTDLNIKSLYNSIPPVAKKYASGAYNASDKTVYWTYSSILTDASDFAFRKDRVLALDIRLSAFYTFSFPTTTTLPTIVDIIVTKETLDDTFDFDVVDEDGNLVVDGSSNQVVATINAAYASERQYKFLTVVLDGSNYYVTFADLVNERDAPTKFADWYSYNNTGEYFDCYLVTGYAFAPNGPSKRKQALYITTFMERTETGFDLDFNPLNESSCIMQSRWDFTDSANANKWDGGQQIYRHPRMFIPDSTSFDDGYPLVVAKSKIRGRGRALQLKFSAEDELDMKLAGWSVVLYGGSNV